MFFLDFSLNDQIIKKKENNTIFNHVFKEKKWTRVKFQEESKGARIREHCKCDCIK